MSDDTEAFLKDATVTLASAALISAENDDQIWAIDGSATFGGSNGLGAAVSVNVITDHAQAYILDSTLTQNGGGLEVSATDENFGAIDARIIAVTASVGVSTQASAAAGTISFNLVKDDTEAYLSGTTYTDNATSQAATVTAADSSSIISLAGAVAAAIGEDSKNAFGAAGAFNIITDTTTAYLEGTEATLKGDLGVTATSTSVIGSVTLGAAVASDKTSVAGSLSINVIADKVDAHIARSPTADSKSTTGNVSSVTTSDLGNVVVSATDGSLIAALSGGVAVSLGGKAGGASIGFNGITNTITAYIADSTVQSAGPVGVSAVSSPLLVAVGAEGAGSGDNTSGAGTLTANAIVNTVDAHIIGSTVTASGGDVTVNSSEAASEYVVALGIAGSNGGSAVGASIALNFLGGQAPLDPGLLDSDLDINLLTYSNGVVPGSTAVGVTSDEPIPVDAEIALPNHGFATGDAVVYHSGAGTPIGGLGDGQTYYVIAVDSNHIELASTSADAEAGNAIGISSTGSTASNQTFTLTKLQSTPAVSFNPTNSSIAGNELYLFSATQSNGTLIVNYNVPLPGTAPKIQVSGSAVTALFGGTPTTTSSTIAGYGAAAESTTITEGSNDTLVVIVNNTKLTITLATGTYTPTALAAELQKELNGALFSTDGLKNGEELVYDNRGGTSIDGLIEGASYYIFLAPDNGIELAASQADALSNAPVPVTLGPNLGSGTGHTLTPLMASPAATFGSSAVNAIITDGNELGFASDPGLSTGEQVTYHSNGGAGIGGLTDGDSYYVISVDSTHIELDPSAADATSQDPTQIIKLTSSSGTGTFTVPEPASGVTAYIDSSTVTATSGKVSVLSGFNSPTTLPGATTLDINPSSDVTVSDNAIHFASPDGLTTGQEVVYHNGGGTSIGGLTDGHSYYVIVLDPDTIQLAATYNDAVSGTPLQANVTAVATATDKTHPNQVTLSPGNIGLYTGEVVEYVAGSGTPIGGLTDGKTYYVIDVDPTHIMVADSLNDANEGYAIPLTSAGTGTFLLPTSSTPIPLSSTGTSSRQTITPLNNTAGSTFAPSAQTVTLPGSTIPVAMVSVTQSFGKLTITANDGQFQVTGGDAKTGLLGSAPTTSGDAITGSASADNLTITKGSNDTLELSVNGTGIAVTLAPGTYSATDLATEVQTAINAAIAADLSVTDAITFASPHGLTTGQEVVYHSNGAMTVTQNNGTLVLDSNGPAITVGGNAAIGLFGSSPTTSNSGSTITGSGAANLTIGSSNDTLEVTASGTALTITLTHGTYTAAALAGLLQQAINDLPALKAIYDIGGLSDGDTYYVIKVNDYTIQLASKPTDANAGKALTLDSLGYGTGQSVAPTEPVSALTFGASAVATTNPAANEIGFANSPNLATGDAVIYENGGGTSIGGLTDGQTYYVIDVDATHLELAGTYDDAVINQPIALTSPGTGSSQSLVVKPTQLELAGVVVALPTPISGQIVSVTAAGAGGTNKAGAGAVNLNFVRMNVDAYISDNATVKAAGDVDVEANDTSKIGSGTVSLAVALGDESAINASVGVNDIENSIRAYVQGATVHSTGGAVNVNATETAQDINVVVGGAASSDSNAFGGSFALNFITNTVDAHIAAGAGVGLGGTPSVVTASGPLSVVATDTASIATLAGNIAASLIGSFAGAAAVAVNDIQDTDTAIIDDSTATSGGAMLVQATFARPTALPAGLDVQIAAMAVSGAGTVTGKAAFAGSLSLNWIDNKVEAEVSNIAASQSITAGGKLSVLASDASTIDSLAGAIAIVGIGTSAISAAVGASISFNYLGGDPNDPGSPNHNLVRAAIENVAGRLKASQIDVSASYNGAINNITVAGSFAGGTGFASVAIGGAVSINIIHDTSDAHISGSPDITTTAVGPDSLDVTAVDTSTIQALAGGVGIAVSTGTLGLAAGVSVASNEIGNTTEAYVDNSTVTAAGDLNLTATSMPTIRALTIGVAVAVAVSDEAGGVAGSGAGAGSGDTVHDTILAYINNSTVTSSAGAIQVERHRQRRHRDHRRGLVGGGGRR